jgi:hypothetical protein
MQQTFVEFPMTKHGCAAAARVLRARFIQGAKSLNWLLF